MCKKRNVFQAKSCVVLFLLLLSPASSFRSTAQQKKVDSLLHVIRSSKQDTCVVDACLSLTELISASRPDTVIPLCTYALEVIERNKGKAGLKEQTYFTLAKANALNDIASVYYSRGLIKEALEYYHDAIAIQEQINNKRDLATSFNNLGAIFIGQGQLKEAMDYFNKALLLQQQLKDSVGIARSICSIGVVCLGQKKLTEALDYLIQSLRIRERIRDEPGISYSLNNIGAIYFRQGKNEEALECYRRSLAIKERLKDKLGLVYPLNNIGDIYLHQKNYKAAYDYANRSLNLSKELGYPDVIKNAERLLSKIDSATGNGMGAFEHYKRSVFYRDSASNEKTRKAATRKQLQYEYEKKEALLKAGQEKERAIAEEKSRKQQIAIWAVMAGLILAALFSIILFRSLKLTNKQKLIIEEKNNIVEEKQREILDSITYAKRLQEAILPSLSDVTSCFPENFILYRPKDIVAGDFYWMEQVNDFIYIAAADSTGHGVPGALVSIVCSNALNRAVKEFELKDTGSILDKTRELVLETFSKSVSEVKDGMDISLLAVNSRSNKVFWSGANNSLLYIENGKLQEVRPDKQSIGKTEKPQPFTTHVITPVSGTIYYLFTDGFADQFGGPKGKKFKYKQMEELLLSNAAKSMAEQRAILSNAFEFWKKELEQVDDVTVIGIRI
ncbi:MAG: tetratricopeptide repeat protein [Bacteroidia bacterium]